MCVCVCVHLYMWEHDDKTGEKEEAENGGL